MAAWRWVPRKEHCESVSFIWGSKGWGSGSHKPRICRHLFVRSSSLSFSTWISHVSFWVSRESPKEGREEMKHLWSTERIPSQPEHPRFEEEIIINLEDFLNVSWILSSLIFSMTYFYAAFFFWWWGGGRKFWEWSRVPFVKRMRVCPLDKVPSFLALGISASIKTAFDYTDAKNSMESLCGQKSGQICHRICHHDTRRHTLAWESHSIRTHSGGCGNCVCSSHCFSYCLGAILGQTLFIVIWLPLLCQFYPLFT